MPNAKRTAELKASRKAAKAEAAAVAKAAKAEAKAAPEAAPAAEAAPEAEAAAEAAPAPKAKTQHRDTIYPAYRASVDINRGSVPIKPVGDFKIGDLHDHGKTKNFGDRMQPAFRYLANHASVNITDENASVPRYITDENGVACVLENGCGRDMLSSGFATLESTTNGNGRETTLTLTAAGFRSMQSFGLAPESDTAARDAAILADANK